jgi:hypothetical protein
MDIVPWIPSNVILEATISSMKNWFFSSGSSAINRIETQCPNLKRLRLWSSDEAIKIFASGLSSLALEELDVTLISDEISGEQSLLDH